SLRRCGFRLKLAFACFRRDDSSRNSLRAGRAELVSCPRNRGVTANGRLGPEFGRKGYSSLRRHASVSGTGHYERPHAVLQAQSRPASRTGPAFQRSAALLCRGRTRRRALLMKKLHAVLLTLGVAFLTYMVWTIGIRELWHQLTSLGW